MHCYLDDAPALAESPGLSSTQLSSDKSHSGSRSQQNAVRGFWERIEQTSVVGKSSDLLLIKGGMHSRFFKATGKQNLNKWILYLQLQSVIIKGPLFCFYYSY